MSDPLKIFITYAHTDATEKDTLKDRLAVMEQQGEITIWHDNEILPGDRWWKAIFNNLAESDILLYLVSAKSLASKNCNKELFEAINTHKNIRTIPIILEACDWQQHQLSDFQALPDKGKPINEWEPESKGWQSVVEGIRKVTKNIVDSRKGSVPDQQDSSEHLADLEQQLGNFGLMLGQVGEAIEIYTKAIDLNPQFAEAYFNRGVAYGTKGDFDQEIQDYTKAIDLNPNYAEAYNNHGNAYRDNGELDQAIQDYDKARDMSEMEKIMSKEVDVFLLESTSGMVWRDRAVGVLDLEGGFFEEKVKAEERKCRIDGIYLDDRYRPTVNEKTSGEGHTAMDMVKLGLVFVANSEKPLYNYNDHWRSAYGLKHSAQSFHKNTVGIYGYSFTEPFVIACRLAGVPIKVVNGTVFCNMFSANDVLNRERRHKTKSKPRATIREMYEDTAQYMDYYCSFEAFYKGNFYSLKDAVDDLNRIRESDNLPKERSPMTKKLAREYYRMFNEDLKKEFEEDNACF